MEIKKSSKINQEFIHFNTSNEKYIIIADIFRENIDNIFVLDIWIERMSIKLPISDICDIIGFDGKYDNNSRYYL